MKNRRLLVHLVFLTSLILLAAQAQTIISIKIDGSINPATAEFLHASLVKATERGAECLILHLNTPGGLLKSTRVMVTDILESRIPVVVYVSPPGGQSASAGVFITLAAHYASMAPGTNIGAAHPVSLQAGQDTTMIEKATNDAAAFVRTIAEKRHRNVAWAEEAVRKSVSITETEALKAQVIDGISRNLDSLLLSLDGKSFETSAGAKTVHSKGATIEQWEMSFTERLLDVLSDPNIAYIFMLLGMYGLIFELYNPGSILPGVVGGISLILAFYSMHTLPINYAGLALIFFAVILFIADIKVVSHGLLSLGGVISLVLGSMMLIRSDSALEFVQLSFSVILTCAALSLVFFMVLVGLGLQALRSKPTTGQEGLVGEIGEAMSILDPGGRVLVHGEIWNAVSSSGKIPPHARVRVVKLENLTVTVEEIRS